MTNPVALIWGVRDGEDDSYKGIVIWCPGCEYIHTDGLKVGGLHLLPVSGITSKRPTWLWNKDLVNVTLSPSILTKMTRNGKPFICHSFLTDGRWRFLGDCTHDLKNRSAAMRPLPDWVVDHD